MQRSYQPFRATDWYEISECFLAFVCPWLDIGLLPQYPQGDWVIFCHAGSVRVGRVWSAKEKSLEILRHGRKLNPGHGEDRQWDTFILPLSYHEWLAVNEVYEFIQHAQHSTHIWLYNQSSDTSTHIIMCDHHNVAWLSQSLDLSGVMWPPQCRVTIVESAKSCEHGSQVTLLMLR